MDNNAQLLKSINKKLNKLLKLEKSTKKQKNGLQVLGEGLESLSIPLAIFAFLAGMALLSLAI